VEPVAALAQKVGCLREMGQGMVGKTHWIHFEILPGSSTSTLFLLRDTLFFLFVSGCNSWHTLSFIILEWEEKARG
jgi:hypothetical protein